MHVHLQGYPMIDVRKSQQSYHQVQRTALHISCKAPSATWVTWPRSTHDPISLNISHMPHQLHGRKPLSHLSIWPWQISTPHNTSSSLPHQVNMCTYCTKPYRSLHQCRCCPHNPCHCLPEASYAPAQPLKTPHTCATHTGCLNQ